MSSLRKAGGIGAEAWSGRRVLCGVRRSTANLHFDHGHDLLLILRIDNSGHQIGLETL